jgi:hypothetical protein
VYVCAGTGPVVGRLILKFKYTLGNQNIVGNQSGDSCLKMILDMWFDIPVIFLGVPKNDKNALAHKSP